MKLRLISAFLKITYTGRQDQRRGIIRCSMGYKTFSSGLSIAAIDVNAFENYPIHEIHQISDYPVLARYTNTEDEFLQYGPYTPYKSIPYFFIQGEGIESQSPFLIEVRRHVEIVVTPDVKALVNA